jgi:hypothetical protein
MSIVTDTWREMVRRRLWPVALLLLAALAAVPVLLAKEAEVAPAPAMAPAPKPTKSQAVAQADPIVTMASADDARRRRVLGSRKDPFEPAPLPKAKKTKKTTTGTGAQEAPSTPATSGSGGGSTTPVVAQPVTPAPPVGTPPKPRYPLYTLTVRFGDSTNGEVPASKVKRLEALPSVESPVLVYLGVRDGGKVAIFLVDAGVMATGDGDCKPSTDACETIELRKGETEFFDVIDEKGNVTAQYQLDLVDIKRKATSSAARAKQSSKEGRALLKVRASEAGPLRYRFDASTGTVRKLDAKAYKAAVAKAAIVARAALGAG